jgi:hypothetical protein
MEKIYEISESDRNEILRLIRSRSYLGAKNSLEQLRESKGLVAQVQEAIQDLENQPLTFDQRWSRLKEILKEFTK